MQYIPVLVERLRLRFSCTFQSFSMIIAIPYNPNIFVIVHELFYIAYKSNQNHEVLLSLLIWYKSVVPSRIVSFILYRNLTRAGEGFCCHHAIHRSRLSRWSSNSLIRLFNHRVHSQGMWQQGIFGDLPCIEWRESHHQLVCLYGPLGGSEAVWHDPLHIQHVILTEYSLRNRMDCRRPVVEEFEWKQDLSGIDSCLGENQIRHDGVSDYGYNSLFDKAQLDSIGLLISRPLLQCARKLQNLVFLATSLKQSRTWVIPCQTVLLLLGGYYLPVVNKHGED